jgi:hypothetical protein
MSITLMGSGMPESPRVFNVKGLTDQGQMSACLCSARSHTRDIGYARYRTICPLGYCDFRSAVDFFARIPGDRGAEGFRSVDSFWIHGRLRSPHLHALCWPRVRELVILA